MNYAPAIGDILVRPKLGGLVPHMGVLVGASLVLHNTPEKGEHVATISQFAAGQHVRGHRTGVSPWSVISRAKAVLAKRNKYNLLNRNCEHTVNDTVYGEAKSPLATFLIIAIFAFLAWVVFSSD